MADTRTPAQTAMDNEASSTFPAAIRDFQENALLPLLEAVHRAETSLPHWEDRAAAGEATRAAEQTRLLLEDGEIGEALEALQHPVDWEAREPLDEQPFASARKQMVNAWADWRTRHGLDEHALPRTYPFASEQPELQPEGRMHTESVAEGPAAVPDVAVPSALAETVLTPEDRAAAAELSAWRPAPAAAASPDNAPKKEVFDPELSPWKPRIDAQTGPSDDPAGSRPADTLLAGQSLAETASPAESAPSLDLPSDQEAATLATQREAEEQAARSLLAGKSPETPSGASPENAAASAEATPEAAPQDAPQVESPRGQDPIQDPVPRSMPPSSRPDTEPQEASEAMPAQQTHIKGQQVTIRSAGFLTTLAQGFNQRRDLQRKSQAEEQKARRMDAAREKFADFTLATQELERQSAALLQHPVMDAVRQAAPGGLHQADAQQQALVGAIVRSSPDFQEQAQALQDQHAETIRRFDALSPDMEEIPGRERRAYTDIADRHLKKAREHLEQIPDQKGGSVWERLKESFRAIGQRLGMIGPDVQLQTPTPAVSAAPAQVHRPGRH